MTNFHQELSLSLQTGFIDQNLPSLKSYQPKLLYNSKEERVKILSTLEQELRRCEEFWFSVAFVTKDGVAIIMQVLKELEARGVSGRVLVSQYLNFTQPEALRTLLKFKNIDLRIVQEGGFHAKGYIFRTGNEFSLIIGSSNLTATALCVNKEWNLKVSASIESLIVKTTFIEFNREYSRATAVNEQFLTSYEKIYNDYRKILQLQAAQTQRVHVVPNSMQVAALKNIADLRAKGANKALLISATGTGKTFLSAFDVKAYNPQRFLFIVHRENIARASLRSFKRVLGEKKKMGLYTGGSKDTQSDYIFCTIQTLSIDENLYQFSPDEFDYIVIDETHRSGARSYQKVLNHLKPKFLLGMTATPERTDGFDIFKQFDHNIAYEIRLQRALEEDILSNFHYFGVTDITVDGDKLKDEALFRKLISEERVRHIIEKIKFYGCDNGVVRGLVFCSSIEECGQLAQRFNDHGLKSLVLTGESKEKEREEAIQRLESDGPDKIDYIFTRDIFNEGVDIPRVNQVILLRPTESAIVFVQQLGRGLRKAEGKEYLTVIDFIGNYSNNYLVPVALFGDTSYNKDRLRKLMVSGSALIPGASTVNFDAIAKKRIYEAIDSANMQLKRDLDRDFDLLKFQLGHAPTMVDFIEHGSRDPYLYVKHSKSYFEYVYKKEKKEYDVNETGRNVLGDLSVSIATGKRIEDVFVLQELLQHKSVAKSTIREKTKGLFNYTPSDDTFISVARSINMEFQEKPRQLVSFSGEAYVRTAILDELLENPSFRLFIEDLLKCAEYTFTNKFEHNVFKEGFFLYEKYSRMDVLRILNWPVNISAQLVGGYVTHPKKNCFAVFVTYHKSEEDNSTDYEDRFLTREEFEMISKNKRTLKSPEIQLLMNNRDLRIPFFLKKSNDEGVEFYYLGDMKPDFANGAFQEDLRGKEKDIKVVKVRFKLNTPVSEDLYEYFTGEGTNA